MRGPKKRRPEIKDSRDLLPPTDHRSVSSENVYHDFFLLSTREHRFTDYMKWINHPDAIRIHDDVMNYMHDALNSITCYNPAQKMMRHTGLNLYGPTVIKED